MSDNKEIQALLALLEDPDGEVYEAVSNRILQYGLPVVPQLEALWESAADAALQAKITTVIHRLHFATLKDDFKAWCQSAQCELMPAALLTAKFLYPDVSAAKTIVDIERLKKNIWLELNPYLTALEQANVFVNILFGYFGLKGHVNDYKKPHEFLVSNIIAFKKGNQTGNGILCLLLAELLDLPLRYIPLPGHFILGYCKPETIDSSEDGQHGISFFIDPAEGQIFTHHHLSDYLKRTGQISNPSFFMAQNNKAVIKKMLQDFSQCFACPDKAYMQQELQELIAVVQP